MRARIFSVIGILRTCEGAGVNARRAVRNQACSDGSLVKFYGACAADDAVGVTQIIQAPERGQKKRVTNLAPALTFCNSGRAEEAAPCAFVSGKADDLFIPDSDEDRDGLVRVADRNLVGPARLVVLQDEIAYGRYLVRLQAR